MARARWTTAGLVGLTLFAGCAGRRSTDGAASNETAPGTARTQADGMAAPDAEAPPPATPEATEEAFLALAPRAVAVFVGRLVEAGPAPFAWCGRLMTTQWLRFEVLRSLRGDVAGPEQKVFALVVANEPYVRTDAPGLRDEFLVVGGEYVVLLRDPVPEVGPTLLGIARSSPGLLERL